MPSNPSMLGATASIFCASVPATLTIEASTSSLMRTAAIALLRLRLRLA
jgi:hypothetical protein